MQSFPKVTHKINISLRNQFSSNHLNRFDVCSVKWQPTFFQVFFKSLLTNDFTLRLYHNNNNIMFSFLFLEVESYCTQNCLRTEKFENFKCY